MDRLRWLDVTPDLVDLALELAREVPQDREGKRSSWLTDLLVAAAARSLEAELVTLTPERYPMCPGVRAAYGLGSERDSMPGAAS
jgi:predicted nucleic acid-binding protein